MFVCRRNQFCVCNTLRPTLPVLCQPVADGRADEVTVLLQLVQGFLDCLVDGLLDGLTHLVDLVHTAAWLNNRTHVHMHTFWNVHGFACWSNYPCSAALSRKDWKDWKDPQQTLGVH